MFIVYLWTLFAISTSQSAFQPAVDYYDEDNGAGAHAFDTSTLTHMQYPDTLNAYHAFSINRDTSPTQTPRDDKDLLKNFEKWGKFSGWDVNAVRHAYMSVVGIESGYRHISDTTGPATEIFQGTAFYASEDVLVTVGHNIWECKFPGENKRPQRCEEETPNSQRYLLVQLTVRTNPRFSNSNNSIDVDVLSIDRSNTGFGYEWDDLDDLAIFRVPTKSPYFLKPEVCSIEKGTQIMTIGYPGYFSIKSKIEADDGEVFPPLMNSVLAPLKDFKSISVGKVNQTLAEGHSFHHTCLASPRSSGGPMISRSQTGSFCGIHLGWHVTSVSGGKHRLMAHHVKHPFLMNKFDFDQPKSELR